MKNLILITLFSFCLAFGCSKSDPVNSDGNGNNNGDNGNGGNDTTIIFNETSKPNDFYAKTTNKIYFRLKLPYKQGQKPTIVIEQIITLSEKPVSSVLGAIGFWCSSCNSRAIEVIDKNKIWNPSLKNHQEKGATNYILYENIGVLLSSARDVTIELQYVPVVEAPVQIKLYAAVTDIDGNIIHPTSTYTYNYIVKPKQP